MYWIFSLLFVVAVLIPDIVRNQYGFLTEERLEEMAIFALGMLAFLVFLGNEKKLAAQKKERERAQRQMNQAVKDLVDSYSYIGEVNRKMDILMEIALGLTDRSILDCEKESDTYESIINALTYLLRAKQAIIRFVDTESKQTTKEVVLSGEKNIKISNKDLTELPENISIKKHGNNLLVVASQQKINNVRSYLIISDYDQNETNKPKNAEILKLFSSQAIFLYSYRLKLADEGCGCDNGEGKKVNN